ncbi:BCSC C-terminal domain-containing protein [Acidithiobacillus sp. HP-6]|uniref:cellulose synthase subunit BcsC-related outer membrane protein n=1 Tax=unclassified Acidithiobacillus TaxID=2614800 RepID=UPI0018791E03|nr:MULTISPECIES: cellulose synthase subunit BcsC-related outer membrane protein [unclassified Acidithiobacillus]MBE7562610.1 BCSC C-terminal domain-containing protein [Acidithiobacillus sp. HP-6]MBE7568109.1 BCSC C-terminal domain-containing protein [Acidithiobacillus sp. HP-2]
MDNPFRTFGRLLMLLGCLAAVLFLPVRSALASVLGQEHSSSMLEQITGSKGMSGKTLNSATSAIWRAINARDLDSARKLIAQTRNRFQGWRPSANMRFVLAEQEVWQSLRDRPLPVARGQIHVFADQYQHGSFASDAAKSLQKMRSVLIDRELWRAQQNGETPTQIQTRIRIAQKDLPDYHAPAALLTRLSTELTAQSIPELAKKRQWTTILAMSRRLPAMFSSPYLENQQWLAQAEAHQGSLLMAGRYYYRQIHLANNYKEAFSELKDAAEVMPSSVVQILLEVVEKRYPDQLPSLQKWHLDVLLGDAARRHSVGQNERAWLDLQPHLTAIEARHQAQDARLIAAILGALGRPGESLHWWFMAAQWSKKSADWQTVGSIAMADGDLDLTAQSLAHLSPAANSAKPIFAWYYQQRGLQAYEQKDYAKTLDDLALSQKSKALPPGLKSIEAWSLLHLKQYVAASRGFSSLYEKNPDRANAGGIVTADFSAKKLSHAYDLARKRSGVLTTLLPMESMTRNVSWINEIPWRLAADGHIALPEKRSSYLAIAATDIWRGGSGVDGNNFNALVPSFFGQWGFNWHLAGFAQLSVPSVRANSASLNASVRNDQGAMLSSGALSGRNWMAPGLLLGLDDVRSGQSWRVALGWTSPSSLGGGTAQGAAQYRWDLGKSKSYLQLDALRQAVQQTWISYQGVNAQITLSDPSSGQLTHTLDYQWGAAMHNELGGSLYWTGSEPNSWDYLVSSHFDLITGRNLRNNPGWTAYLSAMKPVLSNAHWWAAIGPAAYGEGYAHNQNFSSPGYGDYYSPSWLLQPQLAMALSHWWSNGKLSVAASLGYQWARTAAAPFIAAPNLRSQLSSLQDGLDLTNASYTAAQTSNVSGALNVLFTQQLSQHWFVDGAASYQANPAFSQVQFGLDLRCVLSGNHLPDLASARLMASPGRVLP